jgi:hypothetical protein
MDEPAMAMTRSANHPAAPPDVTGPFPVAEVMRRIQAALREGAPPSYEALLAFGEPRVG